MNFMNEIVVESVDQSHYRTVSENGLSQCDDGNVITLCAVSQVGDKTGETIPSS